MDISKADRVHSYVQAQRAFVPFYGTNLLGSGCSQSEVFRLQSPLLVARNPLANVQPESDFSSVLEDVQGPEGSLVGSDSISTKKSAENHRRWVANHPSATGEQSQSSPMLERTFQIMPTSGALSEPKKPFSSVKRKGRHGHGKPRLPIGISFLHGFVPRNIGPSRLTVSCSPLF